MKLIRKTSPVAFIAAGLPLSALLVGLSACTGHTASQMTESVRPAFVAEVRPVGLDALRFVGEVRAAKRAEVSFPVSGRVAEVKVEAGDVVRAGQVLAVLDTAPLQAQWNAASADQARADAQLLEARNRLDRVRRAHAEGAVSAAELSGTEAEVNTAAAALRAAHAQKYLAKWSLDHATLRAPIAGVISARAIEPGLAVGPGAPALSIDGEGRELSALVPARLPVQPGQSVRLWGESGDQHSRVLRVSSRLEVGGVRRVYLSVPESASVGSTWSVSFARLGSDTGTSALQIPLRAVLPDSQQGQGRVLRLAKDGHTVESVQVRLGSLYGDAVEISSGLAAGERIVVAGASAIQPGTKVQPVAYKAASAGSTL